MNILLVLIPVSILLLALALWAFVWAVRRGQFEGLDSAALDILADERTPRAQGPRQVAVVDERALHSSDPVAQAAQHSSGDIPRTQTVRRPARGQR